MSTAAGALVHVLGRGEPPSVEEVGGKAQSLDRMLRMGLPVPPALCVPVAAHRAYLADGGLAERAGELRARLPDEDARAELAALAHAAPLPAALRAALERALAELAGARLAVRSSAVDEDGARASFAGAHESVLGVDCEPDAVERAVRACWESLWSARAVAYRAQRALGFDAAMAVVVQELVECVASSVAFTKNPVTGSEREVIVCCTDGLGDEMMAGGGDATTFTVDKATRELIDVEGDDGPWPISIAALNAIVDAAVALERAGGGPVDVEAGFDGRRWLLVQSRPVSV